MPCTARGSVQWALEQRGSLLSPGNLGSCSSPEMDSEGPGFSWGAQCSQFLTAMCFGSKVGRGSLCFWCLGTWATLGIGLSHSRVTQPPRPQPEVRRGTRRKPQ